MVAGMNDLSPCILPMPRVERGSHAKASHVLMSVVIRALSYRGVLFWPSAFWHFLADHSVCEP